jgi:hypothetical protein
MLKINPTHEPQTPKAAVKGSSSSVWPWARQALRNRIWAKQMEPLSISIFNGKIEDYYHVKKELKPDKARSQLNTVAPTGAILM